MLARRMPAYRECADWLVDTEGKTPEEVTGEIAHLDEVAAGERP